MSKPIRHHFRVRLFDIERLQYITDLLTVRKEIADAPLWSVSF
jgi:hypothetical protein